MSTVRVCVCDRVHICVCAYTSLRWLQCGLVSAGTAVESAQSNGALSNGFNADSGVQPKDLTVIAFSVKVEPVLGKKEWILKESFLS